MESTKLRSSNEYFMKIACVFLSTAHALAYAFFWVEIPKIISNSNSRAFGKKISVQLEVIISESKYLSSSSLATIIRVTAESDTTGE